MRLFLGEFPVVENKRVGTTQNITINWGNGVHITIHLNLPCSIQAGDKLPLYTEVPDAFFGQVNGQPSS